MNTQVTMDCAWRPKGGVAPFRIYPAAGLFADVFLGSSHNTHNLTSSMLSENEKSFCGGCLLVSIFCMYMLASTSRDLLGIARGTKYHTTVTQHRLHHEEVCWHTAVNDADQTVNMCWGGDLVLRYVTHGANHTCWVRLLEDDSTKVVAEQTLSTHPVGQELDVYAFPRDNRCHFPSDIRSKVIDDCWWLAGSLVGIICGCGIFIAMERLDRRDMEYHQSVPAQASVGTEVPPANSNKEENDEVEGSVAEQEVEMLLLSSKNPMTFV